MTRVSIFDFFWVHNICNQAQCMRDIAMKKSNDRYAGEDKQLAGGVIWLNARILGFVSGIVCGLAIFMATNWLVLKGGDPVGPNLRLLSQYFIGYRVSFLGSLIGFAYGFAFGTLGGALVGWIYNKILSFRER